MLRHANRLDRNILIEKLNSCNVGMYLQRLFISENREHSQEQREKSLFSVLFSIVTGLNATVGDSPAIPGATQVAMGFLIPTKRGLFF